MLNSQLTVLLAPGDPLELSTIVQSGRKRQVRLMINAQQPNRLNSAVLNGASEAVCCRFQSEPALDLVKRTWGVDPVEVSSPQPLQFVGRNLDSGGELRGSIKL